MTSKDDNLADWLRDAHAMEMQALTMMEAQVKRLENYPELSSRIRQHIEETRGQAQRLEGCMQRRNIETSPTKDVGARLLATMQGLGGVMASDEVLKGHMSSYAFEHFEIAAYRILIAAADEIGDAQTRRVCEEILQEEQAMADWLGGQLPETTRTYLARDASGEDAKR